MSAKKFRYSLFPFGLLGLSNDCGRVSGDKNRPAKFAVETFAPLLCNAHDSSQDGLSGGYSQADDHFRANDFNFRFQPRFTRYHLPYQWFLVHPSFSPLDPFEMLDGIGDIHVLARDIGISSALSSILPAGPTNGRPCRSSMSAGCSPTNTNRACLGPSPKTVCVACLYKSQPWHERAALRSRSSVRCAGRKFSAEVGRLVVNKNLFSFCLESQKSHFASRLQDKSRQPSIVKVLVADQHLRLVVFHPFVSYLPQSMCQRARRRTCRLILGFAYNSFPITHFALPKFEWD